MTRYAVRHKLATPAVRTSSGQSNSYGVGEFDKGQFFLNITAGSGTLAAKIQTSPDGTDWHDLVSFASATGAITELKTSEYLGLYLRGIWTISGGGSFTFSLDFVGKT